MLIGQSAATIAESARAQHSHRRVIEQRFHQTSTGRDITTIDAHRPHTITAEKSATTDFAIR